jgi:hypothetical protein
MSRYLTGRNAARRMRARISFVAAPNFRPSTPSTRRAAADEPHAETGRPHPRSPARTGFRSSCAPGSGYLASGASTPSRPRRDRVLREPARPGALGEPYPDPTGVHPRWPARGDAPSTIPCAIDSRISPGRPAVRRPPPSSTIRGLPARLEAPPGRERPSRARGIPERWCRCAARRSWRVILRGVSGCGGAVRSGVSATTGQADPLRNRLADWWNGGKTPAPRSAAPGPAAG